MDFSLFGRKFTRHAGITQLMDDLNQGLLDPQAIMLGGGNPAAIPAMLQAFHDEASQQLNSGELLKSMINYDGPQGKDKFTAALAALLRQEYGWDISAKNIALTNGSQNAFFYLFNLLADVFFQRRYRPGTGYFPGIRHRFPCRTYCVYYDVLHRNDFLYDFCLFYSGKSKQNKIYRCRSYAGNGCGDCRQYIFSR